MPRPPDSLSDELLRVVLASGIGPTTFRRLFDRLGSFEQIASASVNELMCVNGIGRAKADRIRTEIDAAEPEAERELMSRHGVSLIAAGDDDYPPLLARIHDPPVALWIRGELEPTDALAVAVVGSRRCTAYGLDQTGRLASLLAQSGFTIISGGARGIDAEAHRAALRVEGRSIVVCGCGLSRTYPPEHAELFDRIASSSGAIISEYPMSAPPRAEHFPRRNRIISGLSLGVLVIEAGRRSGALITARLAAEEQHREVMALPGRVDSPASAGCLEAIRDGWAALVTDHADIITQLESSRFMLEGALTEQIAAAFNHRPDHDRETPAEPSLFQLSLTDRQRRLVDILRDEGQSVEIDRLVALSQIPAHELMADLTILQIQRIVARDDRGVRLAMRRASEAPQPSASDLE